MLAIDDTKCKHLMEHKYVDTGCEHHTIHICWRECFALEREASFDMNMCVHACLCLPKCCQTMSAHVCNVHDWHDGYHNKRQHIKNGARKITNERTNENGRALRASSSSNQSDLITCVLCRLFVSRASAFRLMHFSCSHSHNRAHIHIHKHRHARLRTPYAFVD